MQHKECIGVYDSGLPGSDFTACSSSRGCGLPDCKLRLPSANDLPLPAWTVTAVSESTKTCTISNGEKAISFCVTLFKSESATRWPKLGEKVDPVFTGVYTLRVVYGA